MEARQTAQAAAQAPTGTAPALGGCTACSQSGPTQVLQPSYEQRLQLAEAALTLSAQQVAVAAPAGPAERQAAAAGDSSSCAAAAAAAAAANAPGSTGRECDCDEDGSAEGEEDGFDAELGAWLAGRLQRMQPGAELSAGSVRVLGRLLDEITIRVLDEAQRVNAAGSSGGGGSGGGNAGAGEPVAAAPAAAAAAVEVAASAAPVLAAQAGQHLPPQDARRSRQQQAQHKPSTLTSLDIHKVRWRADKQGGCLAGQDGRARAGLECVVFRGGWKGPGNPCLN